MKKTLFIILLFLYQVGLWAHPNSRVYDDEKLVKLVNVQSKNYYLLTLINQKPEIRRLFVHDTALANLADRKRAKLTNALKGNDFRVIIRSIQWNNAELRLIKLRTAQLFDTSPALRNLVNKDLIKSGRYALYDGLTPKKQVLEAMELDLNGVNWALAAYGEGRAPHYPQIDSISFRTDSAGYISVVRHIVEQTIKDSANSKVFFMQSMNCGLAFLSANGRDDAANYEPLQRTVNKYAVKKVKTARWSKYKYSVLLVPGEGPEQYDIPIDQLAKLRLKLAAKVYQKKWAPFILVSGGKVHPYKTPYCEAEQMKKFLMDSLNIPECAIIMEPHARHTTTNMRNGARLMIRYGFPMVKPGLIVCEKEDADYISQMDRRCENELGYVPYRLGKRVNDTELEFYPLKVALTINSTEPLDP